MVEQEQTSARPPSVLADPSARSIARVYATAFLEASATVGQENALEEFRSFLDDVLEKNSKFSSILLSGMVSRDDKLRLIDRIIAQHGSEFFVNFLRVLVRHDRLDLLPLILGETQREFDERAGRRAVQVTSARPLSDEAREKIRERLKSIFSFEPMLEERTAPSLLGGLVIRVDDNIYDSSLRTRLKQLGIQLRKRKINEIQSGRDRFSNTEGD